MSTPEDSTALETQIDQWRSYLRRRQAIQPVDIAELEDHLREQVSALVKSGLAADEAFLVAVKRMGNLDAVSREFAREHSDRLWKQLVLVPAGPAEGSGRTGTDILVALAFAVGAGVLIKLPALLFGLQLEEGMGFYARNLALFALPLLAAYFAWKRRLSARTVPWLAAAFVLAGVFANAYPLRPEGDNEVLTALHLPIALWLIVGVAYAGGRWRQTDGRMDFIRFSGELFIYYVLIAFGGGVLMGLMVGIFEAIGVKLESLIQNWVLPCGAAGAVLVASWLVEAKQSVVENMAPVLTRIFTPLFAVVLLSFLATLLWTGRGIGLDREVLIVFDLLLALVLGLLLYSVSARDPSAPPGFFDVLQVVLVVSALIANAVALWAILARIGEFGFTPNRVAALGENAILLVNLGWSVVLYLRFLRGRGSFASLEKWQTGYLPVYSAWAALVVIVFPPLFGFI